MTQSDRSTIQGPQDRQAGVALVGCGGWGVNHVRVWRELGCLEVVCDSDARRLEAVQDRHPDLQTTPELAQVLDRPDVSALVIATPAPTHARLALRAMEAGKDVLVEKPMSLTVADGERLVEAAARHGRVLMVGHVLEYHPAVNKLRELAADGGFGRIRYLYSNRLNLGRIRTEENALWSFAPHDVAVMLRLLGAIPEETASHGGAFLTQQVADVTLTSLRFPSGVEGHIFVSWLHPFKEHRFVVVGEGRMAVFDDTLPWSDKLVLYPHSVDWVGGQVPVANKAEAEAVPLEEYEPLRAECEDFLGSIASRRPPLTDGESGLRVLRVLEAAQRSLAQGGQPVSLATTMPEAPPYYVHPTATVDENVAIGAGTHVWHYSHIMSGAAIGGNCALGQNVFVGKDVRIGNGVRLQNNVSVYEGVELEDYVFCGPSCVFTNDVNPRAMYPKGGAYQPTKVRSGASIGANATIVCGVTIGRHAFIGAGAVVSGDIPDYALVYGVPARVRGWMCECGTKLAFQGPDATCDSCQREYVLTAPATVRLKAPAMEGAKTA